MHKKKKSVWKKILWLIRPYLHFLMLSFVFAGISALLTLYAPILIGNAVDLIIGKGSVDFDAIGRILFRLAGIIVITSAAQWLMNLCNNHITYRVVKDVRTKAFAKLQKLPLKYVDSHAYGETISRIITDVEQFSDGLLMGFTQFFTGVVTILGTLVFMLLINVKIALVVILITPVSLFVASFIAKRTYVFFKAQSETRAQMTSLVDEMVGNQKVVQAFGYGDRAVERFDTINKKLQKVSLQAIFFSSITNPSTRFVNGLVYTGVSIAGAFTAIGGGITVGQLSCFLSYANQYTKPFNEISSVMSEMQTAIAASQRVFALLDEETIQELTTSKIIENKQGHIIIDHLNFSYDPSKPLIQDFNYEAKPGTMTAIVGKTGCGKTTLINLLMRFYDPQGGKITIDDVNIEDMNREDLRKMYGMVLQDSWLFKGTIKENIAYGKTKASDEEIIEAAKKARVHKYIMSLPQGYDTMVEEDGGNMSQGQMQLVCIARIMLTHPPMLILDEATSSIDTRTELQIQKAFDEMMKGRTTFIVAHRLSTIKNANQIIVMDQGHIVEIGNHEELLQKQGYYHQLYYSQFETE